MYICCVSVCGPLSSAMRVQSLTADWLVVCYRQADAPCNRDHHDVCWGWLRPRLRSWAVKLMFIAWAIFSVIMLSAYTANLTAHLTISQLGTAVSRLSDLASSSLPVGVPADGSVRAFFRHSIDPVGGVSLAGTAAPTVMHRRFARGQLPR